MVLIMKTNLKLKITLEIPEGVMQRLAEEADRRGITVPDLIEDGINHILDGSDKSQTDVTELDRSNEFNRLTLQERIWSLPSLTDGERLTLLTLARLYDWDTGQIKVSKRQVLRVLPLPKDAPKEEQDREWGKWKTKIWRLRKQGYIHAIYSAQNQHESSIYEFLINGLGEVNVTSDNEALPPIPTRKSGGLLVDIANRDELYRIFDEDAGFRY